jgi:ATP-dependent DNA ligase
MKMQKVLHLKDALKLKNPKLDGEYIITEKIEGWYVTIEYRKSTGLWYAPVSSAGRMIPSLAWTANLFDLHFPKPHDDCTIIAEAYIEDTPFHILNGIFNKSIGNFKCKDVVFKVHDMLIGNMQYLSAYARLLMLQEFSEKVNKHWFDVLPILSVEKYNHDVWTNIFNSIANTGGEGIVAKHIEGLYQEGKRNSSLLKLKLECTVETVAIALEETVGDKGHAGLVVISQRPNGILVRTVVGKHEDQELFRSDRTSIIGKVIQVKAMEIFADGQLRQAVFQHVRHDKDVGDIV